MTTLLLARPADPGLVDHPDFVRAATERLLARYAGLLPLLDDA